MNRLAKALELIDQANSEDPNTETVDGQTIPRELIYGQRMTSALSTFAPDASEPLQIATRSQHICRWQSPRTSYPEGRIGYLKWRADLKKFHAEKTREILTSLDYEEEIISAVEDLLQKKQLKANPDTQALEDVICLVFLEHYFEPFAAKHDDTKVISILQKTWRKMSKKGQNAALNLDLSPGAAELIGKALA